MVNYSMVNVGKYTIYIKRLGFFLLDLHSTTGTTTKKQRISDREESGEIAACGIRVVHVPEQELPILGAAHHLLVLLFMGETGFWDTIISMPVKGKQSHLVSWSGIHVM